MDRESPEDSRTLWELALLLVYQYKHTFLQQHFVPSLVFNTLNSKGQFLALLQHQSNNYLNLSRTCGSSDEEKSKTVCV